MNPAEPSSPNPKKRRRLRRTPRQRPPTTPPTRHYTARVNLWRTLSWMSNRRHKTGRRRQPARRESVRREAEDRPFMPQPLERAAHLVEKFTALQQAHRGGVSAVATATNDLKSCALQINDIGRKVPIFDILDQVRFTQTVTNTDSYTESTHRGSLALLELAALALTAPPSINNNSHEKSKISSSPEAVQRVLDFASDLIDLTMVRKLLVAHEQGDARDALAFVANSRELFVRSPTYEHIAERTLNLLFGDPQLVQVCEEQLGFTALQACDLFKAIDDRIVDSLREYTNRHKRFADMAESHLGYSMDASGELPELENIPQSVTALMRDAFDKLWFPIPAESTFLPSDLVIATGLPIETVDKFLSTFTYVPPAADAGELILEAVEGPSPLRTCPILLDDEGRRFLVHSGIDIYAIREVIEERLKNSSRWHVYDRCRAKYLEGDSVHLLTRMLPTAQVHTEIHYFRTDAQHERAHRQPERLHATLRERRTAGDR